MSKRKIVWPIALILSLALVLSAACAPAPTPTPTPKPTPTPTPTPKPELPKLSWKLQCAWPPPEELLGYMGGYGQVMEFSRKVKERTDGRFDIKVFVPGALFKPLEAPEAVKKGAIEMICSSGPYHGGILPESAFEWPLPYGIKTPEEGLKLYTETDYGKIYHKALMEKHNAYNLWITDVSDYGYMTKFPIRTMADLKGKKIRGAGTTAKVVAAHGAAAVSMAGAEQYTALQRGTIDGTVYPFYAGLTYKMFEVVKYQSWPGMYTVSSTNLLVNLDAWKTLPKEYQDILQEEATKIAKYTFEVSAPALGKIAREKGKADYGVETIWLTDEEYNKFREAAMPLWEQFGAKSDYCAQMLKIFKDFVGVK